MAKGTQKELRIWLLPEEIEHLTYLAGKSGNKRVGKFVYDQILAGFKIAEDADLIMLEAERKRADVNAMLERARKMEEQVYKQIFEILRVNIDDKVTQLSTILSQIIDDKTDKMLLENTQFMTKILSGLPAIYEEKSGHKPSSLRADFEKELQKK